MTVDLAAETERDPLSADEDLHRRARSLADRIPPRMSVAGLMVLGIEGYVAASLGSQWGLSIVIYVVGAIILHELAQVALMRLCGCWNARMLFLPMVGRLIGGRPAPFNTARNALVALAGPFLGIFAVLLLCAAMFVIGPTESMARFAWALLLFSALQFLPFVPLDGGNCLDEVLLSRSPRVELVFRLLSIGFFAWLAVRFHEWIPGAVATFMLLGTSFLHRRARAIADARREFDKMPDTLDLETLRSLRSVVARILGPSAIRTKESIIAQHVHDLWFELRRRYPDPGTTAAVLIVYAIGAPILIFVAMRVLSSLVGSPTL